MPFAAFDGTLTEDLLLFVQKESADRKLCRFCNTFARVGRHGEPDTRSCACGFIEDAADPDQRRRDAIENAALIVKSRAAEVRP